MPEIFRVLSPAGKMAFIMHDTEGELAQNALETLDDCKTINDIIRCDELILQLADLHNPASNKPEKPGSEAYKALLDKIQANMNIIQSICSKHPEAWILGEYRSRLYKALQESQKAPKQRDINVESMLKKTRQVFTTTTEVKEDLVKASLNKKERKHLLSMIKQAGFQITEDRVLEQKPGTNWGMMIAAKRKPPAKGPLGLLRKILPG
ncbi:MAG: hypothetical protein OEU86_09405 [Gammaproteobacteria bacterium]|nr:hypothetical protein [Gammaproteobacteria bacterium]